MVILVRNNGLSQLDKDTQVVIPVRNKEKADGPDASASHGTRLAIAPYGSATSWES